MEADKIEIVTTVVDDTAPGVAATNASLDSMAAHGSASGASLASSFKSAGSALSGVGKSLTTFITLPIVAAGVASTVMAVKFQQDMTLIQTQAGASAGEVKNLSAQVLTLATNSKFGPDELSTALYHLVSVGMNGADAMKALNAAQQLAAVGNAKLEDTTQAVSVAWKSGIAGAQNFQQAVGSLNAIVGAGDMHMDQLVQAMGPTGLLAASKAAGISLNDVGSAEALLSDMTGNAQQSATHLRMALMLMDAPSAAAQKALAGIGIGATQLGTDLQEGGLPKALNDLRAHLQTTFGPTAMTTINTYLDTLKNKGSAAADAFAASSAGAAATISKAFGGAKSGAVMEELLSNPTGLSSKETQIAKTSNTASFSQDVAATQATTAYKLAAAWASIQATMIKIGNAVMPTLAQAAMDVANAFSAIYNWFNKLSPSSKKWVEFAVLFAAMVGPVMMATGAVLTFVGAMLALGVPAIIAIAAIVALTAAGAALVIWWKPISGFFKGLWKDVSDVFHSNLGIVITLMAPFIGIPLEIMTHWSTVVAFFQKLWSDVTKVFKAVNWASMGEQAVGSFLGPFAQIPGLIAKVLTNPIKGAMHDLHIPGFASGVQNYSGGLAMVGENGPELVNLPGGSSVYSNQQSKQMTGGTTVTIGQVVLSTSQAVKQFFTMQDQGIINASKGLTASRTGM